MEKSIANIISVLLSMTVHADLTETAHTAQATERIRIKLENIVLEKNPWLGKPRDLSNIAKKIYELDLCFTV